VKINQNVKINQHRNLPSRSQPSPETLTTSPPEKQKHDFEPNGVHHRHSLLLPSPLPSPSFFIITTGEAISSSTVIHHRHFIIIIIIFIQTQQIEK